MSKMRKHFQLLAVTTLLAVVPLGAASAQAVEGALERLKALVADQGAQIDWASQNISGDNATLVGVSVGNTDGMLPIGDVTLTGISQAANGYRIDGVAFDRLEAGDETGRLIVDGVSMAGVLLPNEGEQDNYGGFVFYENVTVGTIDVNAEGTQVFLMNDLHADITFEDGSPMDYTGAVESFMLDLSIMPDDDQKAVLEALGYLQLRGYMEMAGSWNPEDGRLTMSQNDFAVVDAGTFGVSFDLAGYTPAFIGSLRRLQQQMLQNPDGDSAAQGFAILGLMQQLSFHGAEVSFSDDSLTNKVLEFVAAMQGMSPSDIANQAKAVLPFVLAELKNPELSTQATQAVSRFLDNPGVLRISARPSEPVPFAMIAAGAMSAPEELTKTLAVTVTAND